MFNVINSTAIGQVTGALVAGPLIAAVSTERQRRVLIAGALALIAAIASGVINNVPLDTSQVFRFILIASCTAIGFVGAGSRLRSQRKLVTMEQVAKTAQLAIMASQVPPVLPTVQIAFRYLAASQHLMIGGDAYEFLHTPHGLRILVADAMGKGTEAVRTASLTLGAFRELAHQEPDLPQLLLRLNDSVLRSTPEDDFTTALVAQLNDETLTFVVAGHPAPIRVRDGVAETLQVAPAPPLSLIGPNARLIVGRAVIRPGDSVLMFSDGLPEARNEEHEFFPLHQRVEKAFTNPSQDLEASVDNLISELREYVSGTLHDDLVLVVLQLAPDDPVLGVASDH
jgi:serine phosphatase RsbU (regulator of sigma subunit)